jgi:hypothetical protein
VIRGSKREIDPSKSEGDSRGSSHSNSLRTRRRNSSLLERRLGQHLATVIVGRLVHSSRTIESTSSVDVATLTTDQIADLMDRQALNLPPPAGFTAVDLQGRVTGKLTGLFLPSGEEQLIVTVLDRSSDLDPAALIIDGSIVFQATRSNDSIVDRNGMAAATLTGYVSTAVRSVEVSWASTSGVTLADRVEIH